MNVAIIDAELADQHASRHRFPNLACMKLSSFHKAKGDNVELCLDYKNTDTYDLVYVAKVFTSTIVPKDLGNRKNVKIGGTGFFYDKYDNAPMLPTKVEHSKPDYDLYKKWVKKQKTSGSKDKDLKYYTDYSIGFTTRGCTRKCPFCVNRHSSAVLPASPINEFFDIERKKICLLDDNIFAYKDWKTIFNELQAKTVQYKTTFEYKQGLDIRLLTKEKAEALINSRYSGHYIFAFDNISDKKVIAEKCALLRSIAPEHSCKFYVFCAYHSQDEKDIATVFERIKILWNYKCLAYIMKHEKYETTPEPYRNMYIQLGRWCNQPQFQWIKSFREFCTESGGKAIRELGHFEKLHPDFKSYLDMVYPFSQSQDVMERIREVPDKNVRAILKIFKKDIDALKKLGKKQEKNVQAPKTKKIKPNPHEGIKPVFMIEEPEPNCLPAIKEVLQHYETGH